MAFAVDGREDKEAGMDETGIPSEARGEIMPPADVVANSFKFCGILCFNAETPPGIAPGAAAGSPEGMAA